VPSISGARTQVNDGDTARIPQEWHEDTGQGQGGVP